MYSSPKVIVQKVIDLKESKLTDAQEMKEVEFIYK